MPEKLKRWARRPNVQLWIIYLGLVTFGALITAPAAVYLANSAVETERRQHADEVARMQEINRDLIEVITQRLPEAITSAESATQEASRAADASTKAAETAVGVSKKLESLAKPEANP